MNKPQKIIFSKSLYSQTIFSTKSIKDLFQDALILTLPSSNSLQEYFTPREIYLSLSQPIYYVTLLVHTMMHISIFHISTSTDSLTKSQWISWSLKINCPATKSSSSANPKFQQTDISSGMFQAGILLFNHASLLLFLSRFYIVVIGVYTEAMRYYKREGPDLDI